MRKLHKNFIRMSVLLFATAFSSVSATTVTFDTVAGDLSSPRGLDLDSSGNLYVSESGYGDPSKYPEGAFLLTRSEFVGPICEGNTSKITKIEPNGAKYAISEDMPSHASCGGGFNPLPFPGFVQFSDGQVAFGFYGLQVSEDVDGGVELVVTVSGSTESMDSACLKGYGKVGTGIGPFGGQEVICEPEMRPSEPEKLKKSWRELVGNTNAKYYDSIGRFDLSELEDGKLPKYKIMTHKLRKVEQLHNPDAVNTAGPYLFPFPTRMENDPTDLLILDDQMLVVDAGANVIWSVVNGDPEVVVVMPNVGCNASPCTVGSGLQESVPTAIARSPDGDIYIGEYAGNAANMSRLFHLDISSSPAVLSEVQISGDLSAFSGILGMDFDMDGNLYTVEFDKDGIFGGIGGFEDRSVGRLTKLVFDVNDPLKATAEIIDDETLRSPTGLAVGNGKVYISNKSEHGPEGGEILSWDIP